MKNYPIIVKNKLFNLIKEMSQDVSPYVLDPGKDFTRNRKITFETLFKIMLSMEGGALGKELFKYFDLKADAATVSAFIQQRKKVRPEAFQYLFNKFNQSFKGIKTYQGHQLLACDGSCINIARNPKDHETFSRNNFATKGYNQLHLNALYDLCNRKYVDALIQNDRKQNEKAALNTMVDRSSLGKSVILVADRGYENYNVFAHIENKGWKYLVRVRDINSNGIMASLTLPLKNEFDTDITLNLTRKSNKLIKSSPQKYRRIKNQTPFDFLDDETEFYPMKMRVLRFKISENNYECIITNLSRTEFEPSKIKELYHLRWGIETSFRELKYAIGLVNLHSKKVDYIKQEIFARLIVYNFCEIITQNIIINQSNTKYDYQLNFTRAIDICKCFLRHKTDINPPNIEVLIQKYLLPLRPGRSDLRKMKNRKAVSFLYRVA